MERTAQQAPQNRGPAGDDAQPGSVASEQASSEQAAFDRAAPGVDADVAEHTQPVVPLAPEEELLRLSKATRSRLRKLQDSGVSGVPKAKAPTTPRTGGRYDFPGIYASEPAPAPTAHAAAAHAAPAHAVPAHAAPAHAVPAHGVPVHAVPASNDGGSGSPAEALAALGGSRPGAASGAGPVDTRPPPARPAAPSAPVGGRSLALVEVSHPDLPPPGALRGADGLQELRRLLGDCRRCKLCHGRNNLVFADGSPDAWVAFVGEGPGADEDRLGRPFVGAAGQLLDRMIDAMAAEAKRRGHASLAPHLSRQSVYIANVVKCRPPGNRTPEPDEMSACAPFLRRQLLALRPGLRAIVALGRTPTQYLLQTTAPISGLRGRFATWEGIPVMPTYHPAYLLRTPSAKRQVWEDLQRVLDALAASASQDAVAAP